MAGIPAHSDSKHTLCPRCGYDLQGALQARKDESELRGRCSECGLDYDWQDILDPRRDRPQWCIEYAQTIREILGRSVLTFFMMLWPWKFWHQLKMSHEVRWIGLGFFLACLTVGSYAFAVLVGNVCTLLITLVNGMEWLRSDPSFAVQTFPFVAPSIYSRELTWMLDQTYATRFLALLFAYIAFLPVGFVLLPVSRRKAKVRLRHLLRIAIYSVSISFMPFLVVVSFVGFDLVNQYALGSTWIARWILQGSLYFAFWGPYPMVICWWAVATTHYLKMPHGWAVSILLSFVVVLSIALLIACLVIVGLVPDWVF